MATDDVQAQNLTKRPSEISPMTAIYLQDACYKHRYMRTNDHSDIVERPERLRAVKIGLAAAIARLEELSDSTAKLETKEGEDDTGKDLADALEKLDLLQDNAPAATVVNIIKSSASINLLNNEAVKFVHGDIDGDVYLENLINWAKSSTEKVRKGESEIPLNLPQGDLYLCPGSLDAIQGALGTVCEAVDDVLSPSSTKGPISKAFVAVRPPGHHCGEDTPCGFCFVNNVTVASAHANLKHGIRKFVILDIDLHHGNGTQSIAWQINEETYRKTLESEGSGADTSRDLQVYYGSIHDILSFPCEDGKPDLVQAASVSIHGPHGQYIENIHLQPYTSDEDFWSTLYPNAYTKLLTKAQEFVELGQTNPSEVLVFISCGFDACEHEYSSMSRHGRRVPTSFYYRFAKDTVAFAEKYAMGRVISVLEGGYSDRALTSGAMAHLCGLSGLPNVDETWWNVENLSAIEKATKKRRGGKVSLAGAVDKWLDRTVAIFSSIDTPLSPVPSHAKLPPPPSTMMLRERKPPAKGSASGTSTPKNSSRSPQRAKPKASKPAETVDDVLETLERLDLGGAKPESISAVPAMTSQTQDGDKKLPRVILRVKDPALED
ncbi:Arginase/deacetylase [Schizopora paradoxa]|uniref:Arginase/deacetylase n=1 Tax=Schizopora paradoxa TaxID=27342 RepID=A0A0H2QYM1_9AGAM|nr:Arginase/deacetylase [Schizopora paradoxa]